MSLIVDDSWTLQFQYVCFCFNFYNLITPLIGITSYHQTQKEQKLSHLFFNFQMMKVAQYGQCVVGPGRAHSRICICGLDSSLAILQGEAPSRPTRGAQEVMIPYLPLLVLKLTPSLLPIPVQFQLSLVSLMVGF